MSGTSSARLSEVIPNVAATKYEAWKVDLDVYYVSNVDHISNSGSYKQRGS